MSRLGRSSFLWFLVAVLATVGLSALGPSESSLGTAVRIVYLHGSWALTADIDLGFSALAGLLGASLRRKTLNRWSAALGYTGLFFWITFIPLSLWAMQDNWNGLYFAEPRFRIAVIFAIAGLVLQLGLALVARPRLTSLFNLVFFIGLRIVLARAPYILHPQPSPIFGSGILLLELFFIAVILLNLAAAFFMARWWLQKLH